MFSLAQNFRFALRRLRKNPGFTVVAVLTLALGIGANTGVFSVINAIMLRTLPVNDPQNLMLLKWKAHRIPTTVASFFYDNCPHQGGSWNGRALISEMPLDAEGCSFSFPLFQAIREKSTIFSSVFAFVPEQLTMNSEKGSSQGQAVFVSGDFFSALGAPPALGRLLDPADESEDAVPAIVVSHHFWQNELGGDRSVLGMHVRVGKALFTIVGITGQDFPVVDPGLPSDFWMPIAYQAIVEPRFPKNTVNNALWIEVMARLKPEVRIAQAASALTVLFAASTTNGPDAIFKRDDRPEIQLSTAAHGLVTLRQNFSRPLFALLVAVAIVLFLVCANLAGLILVRSAARRKELAMRVALGATPGRVFRQLLTESLLLLLVGGTFGVLLGYLGASILEKFLSHNWYQPLQVDVRPDAHVLMFTASISIFVGIVFSLAPAVSSRRGDLVPALKETAGSIIVAGRRRINLGNLLVLVQMVVAMLVLAGTGLLVHSLFNLRSEEVGFDPKNIVEFRVDATYSKGPGGNLQNLYRDLQEQLSSVPGVSSASRSGVLLLSGGGMGGPIFSRDQSGAEIHVNMLPISGSFFETMRIPLINGRTLDPQDSAVSQANTLSKHVVVNQVLARRLFGDQNPVGRHFREDASGPEDEVVGVVANAKYDTLRDDIRPAIYTPIAGWDGQFYFEVRTALDPKAMMPELRSAIRRFDSNLLITDMKTETEQIDQNIYQERLIANLSSLFALLALFVACIGIYGLLSDQVTRRTQEIGVRLAMGAERADVLRLVLRKGAVLAVAGTLLGGAAAFGVTRYLQGFLFGVKPMDPLTMLTVAAILVATVMAACYIPARRAAKVDPMVALRYE